jgi:hypothetical protein
MRRKLDAVEARLSRVFIRRCRIEAAFNTSSDNGCQLRVRHTLRNWGDGGLELSRHQRSNHAHELDGMRPRRCHRRWLAESLPCITEIPKKLLTQQCPRMTQSGHSHSHLRSRRAWRHVSSINNSATT